MQNSSLRVIARVTAKAESVEIVRSVLTGLVEPTRSEAGCLSYHLLQSHSDPTDFATMEEWANAASEQSHFGTSHVQDALDKLAGHLAAEPDIRRYSVVK